MLRLQKNECPKGNACDYSHPPECSFHKKKGLRTWEQVGVQACGQGWTRTKETKEFCGCHLNIGSHPSSGGYHFAKIQSERRPSARSVSDSIEINVTECWKNVPKKYRLSCAVDRCVREREKNGPTLGLFQQGGPSGPRVIRATRKLGRCYRSNHGTVTRTKTMSKALTACHVELGPFCLLSSKSLILFDTTSKHD